VAFPGPVAGRGAKKPSGWQIDQILRHCNKPGDCFAPRQPLVLGLLLVKRSTAPVVFKNFLDENAIKIKNKPSPAILKRCDIYILTISSPPQSRETVPLTGALINILWLPVFYPKNRGHIQA